MSRLDKCSSKPRELTKDELLLRARSTIAILQSDECDVQQKADALRAMVDKVVYSKESGIMDFIFELTYYNLTMVVRTAKPEHLLDICRRDIR